MRIGLVTSQPLSESMGTSTTILGFASALADLGQEVHILTPGEKTRQLKTNLFIHGYGGSVSSLFYRQFMRLYGSPSIAGKTVLRPRVIKTVVNNFAKLISKWLTTVDLDIVEGEQEIAAAACLKATRRNGPPSIAHFHNVWFEECSELGLLKNGDPGLKFLQEMTYDLLHCSEGVITPTRFMLKYFRSRFGETPPKATFVPRGTNPLFSSNSSEDSSKTLVYSGTLAKNEGLELYFNSIRLLRGDCQYAVTGKGRDERRTRNLARDLDISFHWFSKRSAYLDFLSKCSVGIIPWRMTLTRQLGFPMKLLDYMSVGLPVICSNIGSWSEIIESYDIGLLCKPSPPEFASSINLLLSDETRIRSMSQHAAELSEGPFNWRESAKKLIEAYQNCSNV